MFVVPGPLADAMAVFDALTAFGPDPAPAQRYITWTDNYVRGLYRRVGTAASAPEIEIVAMPRARDVSDVVLGTTPQSSAFMFCPVQEQVFSTGSGDMHGCIRAAKGDEAAQYDYGVRTQLSRDLYAEVKYMEVVVYMISS